MTITPHALTRSYLDSAELPRMLELVEAWVPGVYDDRAPIVGSWGHNPTIGIGFNLRNDDVLALVLQHLGVFAADDQTVAAKVAAGEMSPENTAQTLDRYRAIVYNFHVTLWNMQLNSTGGAPGTSQSEIALSQQLNQLLNYYGVQTTFALSGSESLDIMHELISGFRIGPVPTGTYDATLAPRSTQQRLDSYLTQNGIAIPHDTREYKALMSLFYNNPSLLGGRLTSALASGDRVAAWLEIRYASNGGDSSGIAKRRFWESEVFGLYESSNSDITESLAVFRMLQAHRDYITTYENSYGSQVALGNSQFGLSGSDAVYSADAGRVFRRMAATCSGAWRPGESG